MGKSSVVVAAPFPQPKSGEMAKASTSHKLYGVEQPWK
jgi:hypothetical protein